MTFVLNAKVGTCFEFIQPAGMYFGNAVTVYMVWRSELIGALWQIPQPI